MFTLQLALAENYSKQKQKTLFLVTLTNDTVNHTKLRIIVLLTTVLLYSFINAVFIHFL